MSIFTKLFSGGVKDLVGTIGGVVDSLTMSKEEKEQFKVDLLKITNDHEEKMATSAQAELDSYLKDTQSARDANVKIQESANASKLAKNVAYYLDLGITSGFFIMFGMILFKAVPPENKEIFYTGFGLLGGYVASILNFHRGSSAGSVRKQDQSNAMMEKMMNGK